MKTLRCGANQSGTMRGDARRIAAGQRDAAQFAAGLCFVSSSPLQKDVALRHDALWSAAGRLDATQRGLTRCRSRRSGAGRSVVLSHLPPQKDVASRCSSTRDAARRGAVRRTIGPPTLQTDVALRGASARRGALPGAARRDVPFTCLITLPKKDVALLGDTVRCVSTRNDALRGVSLGCFNPPPKNRCVA